MKKTLYFCVAALLMISLYSCDKVDPPYMVKITPDTSTTSHVRKILIEDYTGHNCPYCPGAAVVADSLKSIYGNKVVLLTIHAGTLAYPPCSLGGPYTSINFQTTAGTAYDNFFGISAVGNPNGMINRISVGGSQIIGPTSWTSIVSTIVNNAPDAYIDITNTYNSGTRALNIKVKSEFVHDTAGTFKLCVLIKEDNIHSWQQNNNTAIGAVPIIADYTHHNVLRTDVNGTWGDTLATGVISAGDTIVKNYTVPSLNASWVDSNCSVVVFIYDAYSKTIIQAEEKKIK